jgi:general stress protein YciG
MKNDADKVIREFLARIGRKGGKARAKQHSKAELSKWAKRGGRPKGSGKKSGKRG